jgi:hypothetical protein
MAIKIPNSFPSDQTTGYYKPVVFDIKDMTDRNKSLLKTEANKEFRLMLQVNPTSLKLSYSKTIQRITTRGGWVEQHFGDKPVSLSIDTSTGGFVHVIYGLITNTDTKPASTNPTSTNPASTNVVLNNPTGPITRRDTLSYDSYLNFLALFKNNGAIYGSDGLIAIQSIIEVSFDGHKWYGWFQSFNVEETAESPHRLKITCELQVEPKLGWAR